MLDGKISLSDWHLCAAGHQRSVFEHELYPNVLIKVLTSRGAGGERQSSRTLRFVDRFKRFGAYRTFRREVDEYIEQGRKFTLADIPDLPIPRIFGFVHTERGLGLVVEKVTKASGQLAPTLRDLALSGQFTARHLMMIDEFFERCRRLHIVLMDVNAGNFVVTDRRGFEELICVDGTGEKSFLRIFAFSHRANDLKLQRMRATLLAKLAKTLDESAPSGGQDGVRTALQAHLHSGGRIRALDGLPGASSGAR